MAVAGGDNSNFLGGDLGGGGGVFNIDGGSTSNNPLGNGGVSNPNSFPLIPGGYGNPTGAAVFPMPGIDAKREDSPIYTGSFLDSPLVTPTNPTTPTVPTGGVNNNPFPANGIIPPGGPEGVENLNVASGLGLGNNPEFASSLDAIFGKGFGSAIMSYINNGAGYNPAIAQALINQSMPIKQRGEAAINDAFGAAGSRFSSSAALGLGDFESQFANNQQGQLAQLYNQAADRESNIFQSMFGAAGLHEANKLNIFDKISGGLGLGSGILDLLKQLGIGKSSSGGGTSSSGGGVPSGGTISKTTTPGSGNDGKVDPATKDARTGETTLSNGDIIRNGQLYTKDPTTGLLRQVLNNGENVSGGNLTDLWNSLGLTPPDNTDLNPPDLGGWGGNYGLDNNGDLGSVLDSIFGNNGDGSGDGTGLASLGDFNFGDFNFGSGSGNDGSYDTFFADGGM